MRGTARSRCWTATSARSGPRCSRWSTSGRPARRSAACWRIRDRRGGGPAHRRARAARLARPDPVQAAAHRRHHALAPGRTGVAGHHAGRAGHGVGGPGRRRPRQRLHVDGAGLPSLGHGVPARSGRGPACHPRRTRRPRRAAPGAGRARPLPPLPDVARLVPEPQRRAAARHRHPLHAGADPLRAGGRAPDEAVRARARRRATHRRRVPAGLSVLPS